MTFRSMSVSCEFAFYLLMNLIGFSLIYFLSLFHDEPIYLLCLCKFCILYLIQKEFGILVLAVIKIKFDIYQCQFSCCTCSSML